jgi:hypothetical protein
MSEPTESEPLAAIVALEAGTFRAGQVARRLLAEYADAEPVVEVVYVFGHHDGGISPQLTLSARDGDSARTLARALGIEPETKVSEGTYSMVYERVRGETVIDGIEVQISFTRMLSVEQTAAWRAEQDQAAADAPVAGGAG